MGKKFGAITLNNHLIFNHHSLPYSSKELARNAVTGFLKICLKLKQYGFQIVFFEETQDKTWFRIELAPGYFWQEWYNENKKTASLKDQLRAFLSLETKYLQLSADDMASDLQSFETKLSNSYDELPILRAAIWHNCPIISYPTKEPWNSSPITINITKLEENEKLVCFEKEIINYYAIDKIDENKLQVLQQASIVSGQELWKQSGEIFQNLCFCGDSQTQLKFFNLGESILEQVKNVLYKLDEFCNKWERGVFAIYSHENLCSLGLNVSGESQSVRNNSKMRNEREFHLPNGEKQFFEEHVKLNCGIRIHFYPDKNNKKIYIGYIGKHLSTKKY